MGEERAVLLMRRLSSIVRKMQSKTSRMPRLLAAAVLAALFSCQVLGSMCTMTPPAVEAAAALHQSEPSHPVGTGGLCADSLPSSPKSFGTSHPHAVSPADIQASAYGVQAAAIGLHGVGAFPADTGPPLYTRLSTFRI